MALTSFSFICFFLITGIIYYILPKRCQWLVLLAASFAFYWLAAGPTMLPWLLYGITVTYAGGLFLVRISNEKVRKHVRNLFVILTLLPLFLLKYIRFFGFSSPFGTLAPLGISFYTMSILGYLIDVSRGTAPPQKNYLKHALFAAYFPQVVSGPITFYTQMEPQFYKEHDFNYQQAAFGLQRIAWGFFKKLVISERMAVVVNAVYGQYALYPGWYLIAATVCFAFQLYMDFSGCMDIVLGVSQVFGIILPENFECPFFAGSISEYWRRWHITLGVWFKDYVFYPLLKSDLWIAFTDWSKKTFGKKKGKKLPLYSGMFVLWFAVGMWHGGSWNYIVGSGILHWFYIVSGELLQPLFRKMIGWFRIRTEAFSWKMFRALRTFFLVNIGFVFFRAPSLRTALDILKSMVKVWNPQILFDRSLFRFLSPQEWCLVLLALLIVLLVSALHMKGSVREMIAEQNLVFRWILYLALFAAVLIFGCYGSGYDAAAFIYQNF